MNDKNNNRTLYFFKTIDQCLNIDEICESIKEKKYSKSEISSNLFCSHCKIARFTLATNENGTLWIRSYPIKTSGKHDISCPFLKEQNKSVINADKNYKENELLSFFSSYINKNSKREGSHHDKALNDVQKPSEQQQTRKRIQIITPNNFDKIEYHKLSLLKGKFKCRFIYKDDSKLFINFLNEKGMTEFSVLWDSDILKKVMNDIKWLNEELEKKSILKIDVELCLNGFTKSQNPNYKDNEGYYSRMQYHRLIIKFNKVK
ncbi:hypothetical protein [Mycoplasma sp. 3341]|uniref:hypothetical protein n=1 Tax=Mycoplasma sp. 3341 TaxID=3447506 RepID=UPI003F659FD7